MQADGVNSNRTDVIAALQKASAATGADFNYMLTTAMRESSLKPNAQSSSSSATGLFQFVEQTWLGMVKEHGAQYGLGSYANAITKGADGRYHTATYADRQAILNLRKDAQINAYMGGAFSQDQRAKLQSSLGRDVCGGELYAAHFLGSDAACRLIQMAENNPSASAAKAFPAAAGANRSVFYNADGSSKSVGEVYNWALKKHGDTPVVSTPQPVQADDNDADAQSVIYGGAPNSDARLASIAYDLLAPSWMQAPSPGGIASYSMPRSTFMMTPGVLDLLSSMSPGSAVSPAAALVADRNANS
jgi:hypothetical protein